MRAYKVTHTKNQDCKRKDIFIHNQCSIIGSAIVSGTKIIWHALLWHWQHSVLLYTRTSSYATRIKTLCKAYYERMQRVLSSYATRIKSVRIAY